MVIKWDDYTLENKDKKVSYNLSVDGASYTVNEPKIKVSEPQEVTY